MSYDKVLLSPLNYVYNYNNTNEFVIEIEIIYKENQFEVSSETISDCSSVNQLSNFNESISSGKLNFHHSLVFK